MREHLWLEHKKIHFIIYVMSLRNKWHIFLKESALYKFK